MVSRSHICPNCNKQFKRKSHFDNHIHNRKKQCSDNKVKVAKSDAANDNDIADPNLGKSALPSTQVALYSTQLAEKPNHVCNHCHQSFCRNSVLIRHLDKYCKVKKYDDNEKETIYQQLLKEMEDMKRRLETGMITNTSNNQGNQQINTVVNSNNNNQITNNSNVNIKIVAFGNEDTSFITDEMYKRIINKGFYSTNELIDCIHFNKNRPEHNNVYISNIKSSYAILFDGSKWIIDDIKAVVDKLYDAKKDMLQAKYTEMQEEDPDYDVPKFERYMYMDEYPNEDENKSKLKELKGEVKKMMYNKRDISINTRKKFEEYKLQKQKEREERLEKELIKQIRW